MSSSTTTEYEIVVQPTRGWGLGNWRELWEYRDLLALFVHRDFIARYRQTILGPLWFIVQPVLTTLLFAFVFGRVAGIPTDDVPGPLFYLCGLLGWNYFAQNLTTGGAAFVHNGHIFSKVYFPRLAVPVSVIISNLVALALQAIPFLAFLAYYKFTGDGAPSVQIGWNALLAPLPLLHIAILSLGVALLMSAATAKYRDLIHLNQFIIQLWIFATPVIFPMSKVPERWQWIAWINPMSAPTEAMRLSLLGHGTLPAGALALSIGMTVLILIAGLVAFHTAERTAVDIV